MLTPLTAYSIFCIFQSYIVDGVLSIHHVESEAFKVLIKNLTQGRLSPACRQTVTKQLEQRFIQRKEELKEKLQTLDHVCTTVDCWTSRRRSFLGATVHWIDPETLERKGCCLAIRQITGRHTYDVLAKMMSAINSEFGLNDKIRYTVTDNGANFIKAFKHFSVDPDYASTSGQDTGSDEVASVDEGENEDMDFFEVYDLLNPAVHDNIYDDEDAIVYMLPPHWKCACHTLNLIGANDSRKVTDGLKRISVQTFTKLQGLWNKQNRSSVAADKIREVLGRLLITPGDTRWNSFYDALVQIDNLLSKPESEVKFHQVCDDLQIKRLQPQHKTFVAEYVQVMGPLCCGLDVLQGGKIVGLGHLLPTISIIRTQLNELLTRSQPMSICGPLIHLLLEAIQVRIQLLIISGIHESRTLIV